MNNQIQKILEIFPQSITIIPSYRCNAECSECCFESNPRITHRLSYADIEKSIAEAKKL